MLILTRVARHVARKEKELNDFFTNLIWETRISPRAGSRDFDRPDNPQDILDKKEPFQNNPTGNDPRQNNPGENNLTKNGLCQNTLGENALETDTINLVSELNNDYKTIIKIIQENESKFLPELKIRISISECFFFLYKNIIISRTILGS
jgi:hypothetical protein